MTERPQKSAMAEIERLREQLADRTQDVKIERQAVERLRPGAIEPIGAVQIAYCSEHGLHGSRINCFECGQPAEQLWFVRIGPEQLERLDAYIRDAIAANAWPTVEGIIDTLKGPGCTPDDGCDGSCLAARPSSLEEDLRDAPPLRGLL